MFVCYDSNGKVILSVSDDYPGAACMNIDVPDGMRVESVNPETGEAVIVPLPKTAQEQKMKEMQEQIDAHAEAILALMG